MEGKREGGEWGRLKGDRNQQKHYAVVHSVCQVHTYICMYEDLTI